LGDRDKSAKRKSNLNRSLTEEATKDGGKLAGNSKRMQCSNSKQQGEMISGAPNLERLQA